MVQFGINDTVGPDIRQMEFPRSQNHIKNEQNDSVGTWKSKKRHRRFNYLAPRSANTAAARSIRRARALGLSSRTADCASRVLLWKNST